MEDKIISLIKNNKKYKTISDELVQREIQLYLKQHPQLREEEIKKSESKKMIKEIRKKLHRVYASYQTKKKNKRNSYLQEIKKSVEENNDKKIKQAAKKILATAISAKERVEDYESIYKKIFSVTGKPRVIIDIGAGLNPISFPFMNLESVTYYAYDIDNADIQFINDYFDIMKQKGLNGKAELLDIRNSQKISERSLADMVFMFKIIDLIDTKKKKTSGEIIKKFFEENKTKYIIASFATKTLTRKNMNLPRRIGFENMLIHLKLIFQSFSIENEIFYVISQKN
ncbi:MAG: rRNA (guanine1405-N7)-methyltransferase RmtE [archaeon]|jgi:hypothetical protein